MKEAVFFANCIVLVLVPIYFILHRVYQDGVFGRLALAGIAFGAATFLMEFLNGAGYDLLPQTVLLVTAFTVFLTWHLFRFHTRVARRDTCPPDCAQDRRVLPDRRMRVHERGTPQ